MRTLLLLAAAISLPAAPNFQGQITANTPYFGISVATDGSTLAVGSFSSVDFYSWNGASWKLNSRVAVPAYAVGLAVYKTSAIAKHANGAYAFEYNGTAWVLTQTLSLADGFGTYSGTIVSLFNNTAVIGAPNISNGRGQAYVLARATPGAPWSIVQTLIAQTSNPDKYGVSVALGAVGQTRYLLVGASMFNNASGVVYAYVQSGTTFSIAGVIASPASGTARFGDSISAAGTNALIGAPANLNFAGSAHLYSIAFPNNHLAATATSFLTSPGSTAYGSAVALTSTYALIASPNTLDWHPVINGALGIGTHLQVPAHSSGWGTALASSSGQTFAGDYGAFNNAGAVSWYK